MNIGINGRIYTPEDSSAPWKAGRQDKRHINAQSLKSTIAATIVEGLKSIRDDQQIAGDLKKVATSKFTQTLRSLLLAVGGPKSM